MKLLKGFKLFSFHSDLNDIDTVEGEVACDGVRIAIVGRGGGGEVGGPKEGDEGPGGTVEGPGGPGRGVGGPGGPQHLLLGGGEGEARSDPGSTVELWGQEEQEPVEAHHTLRTDPHRLGL